MLQAAMPGLSPERLPAGARMMKAFFPGFHPEARLGEAFSPVKAALLLDRARKENPSFSEAPDPSLLGRWGQPSVKAGDLLVAVNSVLQDIPPETLKDMPAETLDQLSMLVFDQPALPKGEPRDPWTSLEGVAALSEARAGVLLSKPRGGWEWKRRISDMVDWNGSDLKRSVARRLPGAARFHSPEPGGARKAHGVPLRETVFRHYLEEGVALPILGEKGAWEFLGGLARGLWNSTMPYIRLTLHALLKNHAVSYRDLEGVFLTLPGVPPEKVGVPERTRFVDLRIPASLPLIEIEPGNIFVVPLPSRMRAEDWEKYHRAMHHGIRPWHDPDDEAWKSHADIPGPVLGMPFELVKTGQ
jgi:hypothetical protein